MYQAPTSPQSIGGVLDNGFKLFRESFVQVFLLAAATSLIVAPMNYVAPYFASNGITGSAVGTVIGGGLLLALIALVVFSAIVARIDGVARGTTVSVGDALSIGIGRLPAMIGSWLVLVIAAFVCAIPIGIAAAAGPVAAAGVGLLVVIVGLIAMIWFVFSPYAVVVERVGPLRSFGYSRAIVRGHWWRTAALLTIIGIILLVVYAVIGMVASVSVFTNPETLSTGQLPWYVHFVISPLLSGIGAPLGYALLLAIYYDLKLRHEGADLAARIAAPA
jgi:hypothetical protein